MERGRAQSLLRRIKKSDGYQFSEIVNEVVDNWEDTPDEIKDQLKEKIRESFPIDSWTMGKIILLSRDPEYFEMPAIRAAVLGNLDFLVKALRGGIPHRMIEEALVERLQYEFDNNSYGARTPILEALKDFGSVNSLEILEALDYEYYGKFRTASLRSEIQERSVQKEGQESVENRLDIAITNADIDIGKKLKEAIRGVKSRNLSPEYSWARQSISSVTIFCKASEYIGKAEKYLDEGDLGEALSNIRKATESLLKSVIKAEGLTPRSKEPIDEMMLPALIGIIMGNERKKPIKRVHQVLEQLQKNSTFGSHDQGDTRIEDWASRESIAGDIDLFRKIFSYFEPYVRED